MNLITVDIFSRKRNLLRDIVVDISNPCRSQQKDQDRRKDKVVASLINSLPRLLFCSGQFELQDELHQENLKEKHEFILFFKIVLGKIASAARNLINSSPQTEATTFASSSVFILLLCCRFISSPTYCSLCSGKEKNLLLFPPLSTPVIQSQLVCLFPNKRFKKTFGNLNSP